MPAFNAAAWIGEAIHSVLAQTLAEWQLIVVDDGSTDASAAVAASFVDPRIRLVRQANAGVSAARNRGAAEADAAALLFLDADDRLQPWAFAALATALAAAPDAVAATGGACFFGAAPGRTPRRRLRPVGGIMLPRLLVRNPLANGGHLLIRADALRRAGPFRTDLIYGEDWELSARLALLGRFVAVRGAEPLLQVRERPDGAYASHAADPACIRPCLDAIFGNPALATHFSPFRLHILRRRAEAEHEWIAGRALLQADDVAAAWHRLLRSLAVAPSPRRFAVLTLLSVRHILAGFAVPGALAVGCLVSALTRRGWPDDTPAHTAPASVPVRQPDAPSQPR